MNNFVLPDSGKLRSKQQEAVLRLQEEAALRLKKNNIIETFNAINRTQSKLIDDADHAVLSKYMNEPFVDVDAAESQALRLLKKLANTSSVFVLEQNPAKPTYTLCENEQPPKQNSTYQIFCIESNVDLAKCMISRIRYVKKLVWQATNSEYDNVCVITIRDASAPSVDDVSVDQLLVQKSDRMKEYINILEDISKYLKQHPKQYTDSIQNKINEAGWGLSVSPDDPSLYDPELLKSERYNKSYTIDSVIDLIKNPTQNPSIFASLEEVVTTLIEELQNELKMPGGGGLGRAAEIVLGLLVTLAAAAAPRA